MLMPPNYDLPIKLDIYSVEKNLAINGIWSIDNALNDSTDAGVIINGSSIAFCRGGRVYGYQLTNLVRINLTELNANESCNEGIFQNFNVSVGAYRINDLVSPPTCSFYDTAGN